MKVLICGSEGYIGWPLAMRLHSLGHHVAGIDNLSREYRVSNVGSQSVLPVSTARPRILDTLNISLENHDVLRDYLEKEEPDAIVHLAEQPSAPYSMIGPREAMETQETNVLGTLSLLWAMKAACPDAHLLKLGTMGEYGTPNCDIPEGFFPPGSTCNSFDISGMMFPRQAGSWYHQSKVHDTHNIEMACRIWGLRSTDIMQGVVYGTRIPEIDGQTKFTRFDVDECFGTAINRFCAQAVCDVPLTVYGSGEQTRGFLPLVDSIQCLTLALENPPEPGEYRVFNQFEEAYSINELAQSVLEVVKNKGLYPSIRRVANPRVESEDHYYNPAHQKLFDLGYTPTNDLYGQLEQIVEDILPYKDRINQDLLYPKTQWK